MMKNEVDFSKGERGKFSATEPSTPFKLPIYLDEEKLESVQAIASRKDSDISGVVNDLLRSDRQHAEIIG